MRPGRSRRSDRSARRPTAGGTMAADLSKNGTALMAAYKEVVDGKLDTDWALFTYEGNSNVLRLAGTGEGGLEELLEELNSGKVMYAFCRVQDPNSGLPKYVLINWTGEGVKDSRKGICANHLSSIAAFLKGAHVTINARDEQDVEPDVILQKVAKASGVNFNFHQRDETFRDGPRAPVGSVYRKTNAVEEIQRTKKDDFWAQAQRDEEVRRREESKRMEEERQRSEVERRREEEKLTQERERRSKERAEQMEKERRLQEQREEERREEEAQREVSSVLQEQQEEERPPAAGRQVDEVRSLLAQRSFNPRDVFQQRERSRPAADATAAHTPGKLRSPFLSQRSVEGEPPAPPFPIAPASPAAVSPPPPDAAGSPVPPAGTEKVDTAAEEEEEEEEEEWSDDFDEDAGEPAPGEPAPEQPLYDTPQPIRSEQQPHEPASPVTAAVEDERGVCARALYDYQAADDTEITFDPDDIITQIEMLDEGWWRGYGPNGHYGMFPANYVELLQP